MKRSHCTYCQVHSYSVLYCVICTYQVTVESVFKLQRQLAKLLRCVMRRSWRQTAVLQFKILISIFSEDIVVNQK